MSFLILELDDDFALLSVIGFIALNIFGAALFQEVSIPTIQERQIGGIVLTEKVGQVFRRTLGSQGCGEIHANTFIALNMLIIRHQK